jgi:hypothetical protein
MAERTRQVTEKDIVGLRDFDKLGGLLEQLHDVGCERDRAGNRTLHFDQYCLLVLLYLFNPIVTSTRALQQASDLKKVQRKRGCQRASLGSLSESVCVFDPERLKPIIGSLGEKRSPIAQDSHCPGQPLEGSRADADAGRREHRRSAAASRQGLFSGGSGRPQEQEEMDAAHTLRRRPACSLASRRDTRRRRRTR